MDNTNQKAKSEQDAAKEREDKKLPDDALDKVSGGYVPKPPPG